MARKRRLRLAICLQATSWRQHVFKALEPITSIEVTESSLEKVMVHNHYELLLVDADQVDASRARQLARLKVPFISLATHFSPRHLLVTPEAGEWSRGYLLLSPTLLDLLPGLVELAGHNHVCTYTPTYMRRLLKTAQLVEGELTSSEHQVMELVVLGATNKQVAAALDVSIRSVERHLQRAYTKLHATSRHQAATEYELRQRIDH